MMRWLGFEGVEGWRGIGIAAVGKIAMGRVSKSRIGWYRVDRRKGESTVEPKECRYGQKWSLGAIGKSKVAVG